MNLNKLKYFQYKPNLNNFIHLRLLFLTINKCKIFNKIIIITSNFVLPSASYIEEFD